MKLRLPLLILVSILFVPNFFAQNLRHTVGTSDTNPASSAVITTTVGTRVVQWFVLTNTLPVSATVRLETDNTTYVPGVGGGVYTDTSVITDTSNLGPQYQLGPGDQGVITATMTVGQVSTITSTALLTLAGGAQILTDTAPVVIYGVLEQMQVTEIPTLSEVGIVFFASLLALVGYVLIRQGNLI